MFGYIKGSVLRVTQKEVFINTGAIGYRIVTSNMNTSSLQVGNDVSFWIYTAVRENSIELFGFSSPEELDMFEQLITVSGVGPRSAMNVLSTAGVDILRQAIGQKDTAYLTKISGIGKKIAEKIIIELHGKISGDTGVAINGAHIDAFEALRGLGYSEQDSRVALESASDIHGDVSKTIKQALQFLSKKGK
jgi:holliday junction DNA helicase RuvA